MQIPSPGADCPAIVKSPFFIESGFVKKVIVVGAEKMSTIVDYTDRSVCPIFGDGAGAVLLEATEEEVGFMDAILLADGVGKKHLHQKAGGSVNPPTHESIDNREHYIYQEGQQVFKWAVTKMAEATESLMKANNLTSDDISYLLPHQANLRIITATGERLGLDPKKVLIIINI